jgi:mono/diheme cytochrome c family protein
MNRTFDYGGVTDNQLRAMDHVGLFTDGLPSPPDMLPSMPNPLDASAPLDARARAYLQGNCAHCHHPGGPTSMTMDLRFETSFTATNTCNATPRGGDLGVPGASIIYPGEPSLSVLYLRMTRRDANQMPPLATYLVDTDAANVVASWIQSLAGCP